MKADHMESLVMHLDEFLENCDSDGGNPEWCYETLAKDMAAAAALVYDSCMKGQDFADRQKSG